MGRGSYPQAAPGYPRLPEVRVRRAVLLSLFALGVGALAASAGPAGPKELSDATFDAIRAAILPSEAEERWREIPWRTSTWDAVVEAAATERPILLWAMNGHPLACT